MGYVPPVFGTSGFLGRRDEGSQVYSGSGRETFLGPPVGQGEGPEEPTRTSVELPKLDSWRLAGIARADYGFTERDGDGILGGLFEGCTGFVPCVGHVFASREVGTSGRNFGHEVPGW